MLVLVDSILIRIKKIINSSSLHSWSENISGEWWQELCLLVNFFQCPKHGICGCWHHSPHSLRNSSFAFVYPLRICNLHPILVEGLPNPPSLRWWNHLCYQSLWTCFHFWQHHHQARCRSRGHVLKLEHVDHLDQNQGSSSCWFVGTDCQCRLQIEHKQRG